MASGPGNPPGTGDSLLPSLSSSAEPTAPPDEEEGKLFFDLDQGDLVASAERGVLFDLCCDQPDPEMIPKNSQELVEEDPSLLLQEEVVSPRTYYNSFPQMDLRHSALPQDRGCLENMVRSQHPEFAISWKPQIRIPQDHQEYATIRQDVQIKQGKQELKI